jgi:hypothetical protein
MNTRGMDFVGIDHYLKKEYTITYVKCIDMLSMS